MAENVLSQNTPYLVVGLGNPGPRYARTRHNIGFMVVDELARRHGLRFSKGQGNSEVARGSIEGNQIILTKPQTFMNNSGMAVGSVSRFYRVPIERILVVYDELALPLGTIRIREKGSSAGHNGVKSLISHLGTQGFPRIRVGVDQPPQGRHGQIDWVLSRFSADEQKVVDGVISRAADAVEAILTDGIERAMNFYNTRESNAQGSGIGDRASATRDQGSGVREQAQLSQTPDPRPLIPDPQKPEGWVARVRRIARGEEEAP